MKLVDELQEGGYILYARHAEATVGVDHPNLNFEDCHTQRNLSLNGRRQAILYGQTLRQLQIPIMIPVHASPFCRALHTAQLAFGVRNVQVDYFWIDVNRLSGPLNLAEQERILFQLKSILESPPYATTNRVIIGHRFPEGVGLGPIPDMGTVVIRPLGQGQGFEVVAELTLQELIHLT
ncbi:histidine phosphatase family protein [Caldalkalibacillus salinus]|uniref:histidine phosphatase family protein n=1 Tax=Caldalkalibacillus salinus TaxID=2803787 RepID=UPI001F1D567C|nr:histidine phosphatase family protein [Caldalkalibacillus salinus]